MSGSPSALISEKGQRVQFRIAGCFYELTQKELRSLLGLPTGPLGLGIIIEGDRFLFEFTGQKQTIEMRQSQLKRILARQFAEKA